MPATADSILPRILVLVGPTCSGKTTISLGLATQLNGEIISADSRQIYKYLDVGTAKPPPAERAAIKHHFVDDLLPDQEFNAGEFGRRGREVVARIFRQQRLPIVAGGSGLYIRSLIDGFFEGPGADEGFRVAMEKHVNAGNIGYLLEELKKVDPVSASTIDPTKPRRIIRALEVHHLTGQPLSKLHRERKVQVGFHPVLFGLRWKREELYKRIELRCDGMIANGLLKEVEHLATMGYSDSQNALNTVGYAESFAYRRGEISSDEFVRLFKQNSRRYAKRQLTWFKRDQRIKWVRMGGEKTSDIVIQEIVDKFSPSTPR